MLMRNVFGDKYYGYASAYQNPKLFRRDVRKLVKRLISDVDKLIASDNFKGAMKLYLERIEDGLKKAKSEDEYRAILVYALDAITILLGYHYQSGPKRTEPFYIPSTWQDRQGWKESEDYYKFKDYMKTERKRIVKMLKSEGKTNPEIAELLNISNYKIAQILKELRDEE